MQLRSQTQNHPRLFIKFINFLKSLKNIFTFFFLIPSIEHTNYKRSRPHSSKSVNNFASYKRKTKESKRADFHVTKFCICWQWQAVDQNRPRVATLPGERNPRISSGRVDQILNEKRSAYISDYLRRKILHFLW